MKIKVEYTINNCIGCPFYGSICDLENPSVETSFCRMSSEDEDGNKFFREITYKDLPIPEWCPIKDKKVVKYKW